MSFRSFEFDGCLFVENIGEWYEVISIESLQEDVKKHECEEGGRG